MTRKQLQAQFDALRNSVIAIVRDLGPLTIKKQYYADADDFILGSDPSGDGETATLTIIKKTAGFPETATRH